MCLRATRGSDHCPLRSPWTATFKLPSGDPGAERCAGASCSSVSRLKANISPAPSSILVDMSVSVDARERRVTQSPGNSATHAARAPLRGNAEAPQNGGGARGLPASPPSAHQHGLAVPRRRSVAVFSPKFRHVWKFAFLMACFLHVSRCVGTVAMLSTRAGNVAPRSLSENGS